MGPRSLQSGPNSIWAQTRAEEVVCRGRMIEGRGVKGNGLGLPCPRAFQDFNGKINVLVKAIPKQPPEGDVSGMGPSGKQGARLDQGECVHSTLNAPANVQVRLMRKDVWTV